jgi:hypothetical protein
MKRYITIGILLLGICSNALAYEPKAKQIANIDAQIKLLKDIDVALPTTVPDDPAQ